MKITHGKSSQGNHLQGKPRSKIARRGNRAGKITLERVSKMIISSALCGKKKKSPLSWAFVKIAPAEARAKRELLLLRAARYEKISGSLLR